MPSIFDLNPYAFDARGNLKGLVEQYGEVQMRRELDPGFRLSHPYIVAVDGGMTGVERLSGRPVVLTAKALKHIILKHEASVPLLNDLASEMRDNVLAFEHGEDPDKLTFVLDKTSEKGNPLIVVVRADVTLNRADVSAIKSCHGKQVARLFEYVETAYQARRAIYVNEKTGAWLDVQKHMPDMSELAKKAQKHLSLLHYTRFACRPDHEAAMASLLSGDDWFCPSEGCFADSWLNNSREPELILRHADLSEFVQVRDALASDGVCYEDGCLAPYEVACNISKDIQRLPLGSAEIERVAERIEAGGWVRAGADLDAFIEASAAIVGASFAKAEKRQSPEATSDDDTLAAKIAASVSGREPDSGKHKTV